MLKGSCINYCYPLNYLLMMPSISIFRPTYWLILISQAQFRWGKGSISNSLSTKKYWEMSTCKINKNVSTLPFKSLAIVAYNDLLFNCDFENVGLIMDLYHQHKCTEHFSYYYCDVYYIYFFLNFFFTTNFLWNTGPKWQVNCSGWTNIQILHYDEIQTTS